MRINSKLNLIRTYIEKSWKYNSNVLRQGLVLKINLPYTKHKVIYV